MKVNHQRWMELAAEEYRRLNALLADLPEDEWETPTDCTGWTVRDVVAHLSGAAAATASVREQLRQQRIGGREKGERLQIDAVNDVQIRERQELAPAALREQLVRNADRSVRARKRTPAWVRALRFGFPPPVGRASLGYLNDVVYTRDAWMHRVDLCRATGRPLELSTEHDGAIITEAAEEWMGRTGTPGLTLTGPVGGAVGAPAEHALTVDAVEFARALSGRGQVDGVAADLVLF